MTEDLLGTRSHGAGKNVPYLVTTETVLESVVERVPFESPSTGFRVIKLAVSGRSDWLSVVGTFPPMAVGARVRIRGRIEQDRKHGEQLRVESLIELPPNTLSGLQKDLASGLIPGVGQQFAHRLVPPFAPETLPL